MKGQDWLAIRYRIDYKHDKVILITYKSLNNLEPEYLTNMFKYNNKVRSKRYDLETMWQNIFLKHLDSFYNMFPFNVQVYIYLLVFSALVIT